jgi:hypothetical protein
MKIEFYRHIFEQCSNIEIHESRPVEVKSFHADGRTDRQTDRNYEVNSFSNIANALKIALQAEAHKPIAHTHYILGDILK